MKNIILSLIFLFSGAHALDEGMWTYTHLPKDVLKDKYAFEPTEDWLRHLMLSSVRLNSGGSGSFISSNGLVLTNHHVAANMLAKISTATKDYYKDGFVAQAEAEEIQAPDLEINQLINITDVTERVVGAVKNEMTPGEAFAAKQAMIASIEKDGRESTGLRSDVVTLYNGGQYHLYQYKKYTDVRLVFAPEFDIAFFGGDPDNFEYPRYDLDMTLFRVYENGKPAQIKNYLKWNPDLKAGELVFVSGHPGRTSRLQTSEAYKFNRDYLLPYTLELLFRREIALQQYSMLGDEQARQAKDLLFGVQNSRKVYMGQLSGLQDPKLMSQKEQEELGLKAALSGKSNSRELISAYDDISKAQKANQNIFVRRGLLETGHAFNSKLFSIARTLVRMAYEDKKPNVDRLPAYRDSGRQSLEQSLYSKAPIYRDLERATLTDSLVFLVDKLGGQDAVVQKVLQGRSPRARALELTSATTLYDVEVRKSLAQGGVEAIENSTDPMIVLARSVDAEARAVLKTYEQTVSGVEEQAYARIAQGRYMIYGTKNYPDATFTLRLAFGTVTGYKDSGSLIEPLTTMGGAFEHQARHKNKEPWLLPQSWHDQKANLDLNTPFNFISTADIIGGNSGSPVVNRAGELVGLIFDGNIHSTQGNYFFDETLNRAVAVHAAAMLEAMRKIYGAGHIADQIGK